MALTDRFICVIAYYIIGDLMPICQNPECNKEFDLHGYYQRYCSKQCRERMHNVRLGLIIPVDAQITAKIAALAKRQQDLNGFLKLGDNCEVCNSTENLIL